MILGTDTVNVITLKGQPSNVFNDTDNQFGISSPQIYSLTNYLEIPHILSVSFKPLETQNAINSLEFEGKTIARLDFVMKEEHRAKSRDITEFLNEVSTDNNSLLEVSVQCYVWNEFSQTKE